MKEKTYTFRELKESKLIYDRKAPAFGVIFTLIMLVFVVAMLIWAGFSTKTYVVKATGIVSDKEKTNIMTTVSGKIEKLFVSEGEQVDAGDEILAIDTIQVELQIQQIKDVVRVYQEKIDKIERVVEYVSEYDIEDTESQRNPFGSGNASEMQYYAMAQTFSEYVAQNMAQAESSGSEYTQADLDSTKSVFLAQQGVYSALDESLVQKAGQESQQRAYEGSLAEYTVRAKHSGVVHITAGVTEGTVIQAGTLLGTLSSGESDNLYIDAVINATERSKIVEGDSVEIALGGVMQAEYGVLLGTIEKIDSDGTQTEQGQVMFRLSIVPSDKELCDRKGNSVALTSGMLGECRIKYDETTWLMWAIEQIGIKFR